MKLQPGEVVDRYQIEAVVGEGGMARVYRARHTGLGTLHALKLLTVPSNAVRDRMLQEGRVQASLKHPNIVSVHDIIEIDGSPGLVMEYIDGPSLAALLHHMHPLDLDQLDALADGIFAGVAHAHALGIVHRDLKPANVLLAVQSASLVPKITDFGLAKLLATDPRDSATRSGVAMGTPSYMAPEQVRDSKAVGPAADIWSLGAVLYELVTGTRAFVGNDLFETYQLVTSGDFTAAESLRPDLPQRMQHAIAAALTVDRDNRVATVEALKDLWLDGTEPGAAAWDQGELERAASLGFGGRPWSASESVPPSVKPFDPSLETYDAAEPAILPQATFTGVSITAEPSASELRTPPARRGWLFVPPLLLVLGGAVAWEFWPQAPAPEPIEVAPTQNPIAPRPTQIPELLEPAPMPLVAPGALPSPKPAPVPVPVPVPVPAPAPAPAAAPQPVAPAAPTAAPQPPPQPAPEPAQTAAPTRIDVTGFDRVHLLNVATQAIQDPGEVGPGRWQVVALFGDQPTPSDPFDVKEGQQVSVKCSKNMGQCFVQP